MYHLFIKIICFRGKRCPIILACFDAEASSDFKHHRRNDLLALVDAQGEVRLIYKQRQKIINFDSFFINLVVFSYLECQIYCMSMAENDYFSVRFVPQPISSVCFVPSNRYCLIVAYENTGMVVLFNLKVRSTFSGSTVVEVTVCHGHSDFVSINYFDRILYYALHRRRQLWETCRCPGIY